MSLQSFINDGVFSRESGSTDTTLPDCRHRRFRKPGFIDCTHPDVFSAQALLPLAACQVCDRQSGIQAGSVRADRGQPGGRGADATEPIPGALTLHISITTYNRPAMLRQAVNVLTSMTDSDESVSQVAQRAGFAPVLRAGFSWRDYNSVEAQSSSAEELLTKHQCTK